MSTDGMQNLGDDVNGLSRDIDGPLGAGDRAGAAAACAPLLDDPENRPAAVARTAACRNHLGLLSKDAARPEDASEHLQAAAALREELAELRPDDVWNRVFLGGALCNRGHLEREQGRGDVARELYDRAADVLEAAIPPCDCGCRDAAASAFSNVKGHPHWIVMAHAFLANAEAGVRRLDIERAV